MIKLVQVLSCFILFGIISNEKFQCSLISTTTGQEKDQQNTCSFMQYRRPYVNSYFIQTTQDKIIATKTQKGVVSSGTYNMNLINQKQRETTQQPVINIHLPLYFSGQQINQQTFNSAYTLPEISSVPLNIGFYPWSSPTPMKFGTDFIPKSSNILPWSQSQIVSTIPSSQIIKNQTQIRTSVSIPLNQQISNPIIPLTSMNTTTSEIISTITKTSNNSNNSNISQSQPINFPPPSLNFSVIPNLTNINTTANTSSFSYTAPLNLSATLSNQNSNSSIVHTNSGYSSSSSIINPNPDFTFVSINSSLINQPSSSITHTSTIPNISSFSTSSSVNTPASIPYTSIDDFSAQLLNLSPTPPEYKPSQQIITTPLLGIGQNINLSGFLNATDLAILGCDQYGNC